MSDAEKLTLLKADLQLLTNTQDNFLSFLLEAAAAAMNREGILDDESADYNACQIQYAAYLFRKRAASTAAATLGTGFAPAGGETAMPRFLRRMMTNILMSQKIQTSGAAAGSGSIRDIVEEIVDENAITVR